MSRVIESGQFSGGFYYNYAKGEKKE